MDNFLIQQREKMEQHYNLDKGNQVSQIWMYNKIQKYTKTKAGKECKISNKLQWIITESVIEMTTNVHKAHSEQ